MKILLIYPQVNVILAYNYGLGYIAATLKEGGHTVDYYAFKDDGDTADLCQRIAQQQPGLIGFSVTSSQANYIPQIVKSIREISKAFIVCGGIHPTLKPEYLREIPELNAIIRGEGEFPLRDLADALDRNQNYLEIKNFWFQKDNSVIPNDIRPTIDLDALPFPDKTILDYQGLMDHHSGMNRFIFSRGCLFDCPYCSNRSLLNLYQGKGCYYRIRSPNKAIEEIGRDASIYKFRTIFFDDDIICLDKEWFFEFFNAYKKQFKYPFYCNVRPGTITADMIRLLKEAGAIGVAVGIEHGNEDFRKRVLRRDITNQQTITTIKLCEEQGIVDNYGQIMIGLPRENINLFVDTIRFCRKLNIRYFTSIFSPYPGTEFAELCIKNGWMPDREFFAERRQSVIDYPDFTKKDIQLCFDCFDLLLRFKSLPLKIPMLRTQTLLRIYLSILHLENFVLKRINFTQKLVSKILALLLKKRP